MANCNLDLYFPGWVVIIKVKANLISTGTGLPTGTELGKNPVYKNVRKNRYIARPEGGTITNTPTYSWGVNSKEGATWGWIKALEDQPCPHMVTHWGVFRSKEKMWVRDKTLEIKCSTKYGE